MVKDIESQFVQLNEAIRQLDVEVRNCNVEVKQTYQKKVLEHRKNANQLQNNYQQIKQRYQRGDLLDGKSRDDQERYSNVNEKLLSFFFFSLIWCPGLG